MNELKPIDDIDALIAAAQDRFQQKDYAAAVEAFATIHRLRPGKAHFADRHAHCHSLLRQWPQARDAWSKVINEHGMNVGRVNGLAHACIELKDYATAHATLTASQGHIDANTHSFIYAATEPRP